MQLPLEVTNIQQWQSIALHGDKVKTQSPGQSFWQVQGILVTVESLFIKCQSILDVSFWK